MAALHVCPVCDYSALVAPIEDSPVCPSCGTEFEIDDRYKSPRQLRLEWLSAGAPWFSSYIAPPLKWDEHRARLLALHASNVNDVQTEPFTFGESAPEVLAVRYA